MFRLTLAAGDTASESEAMTHRTHVFAAACLCFSITMPVVEASECFSMGVRTTKKYATLVFEGTVTKVEELENDESRSRWMFIACGKAR